MSFARHATTLPGAAAATTALLLLLVSATPAQPDSPTTETLRLDDLFTAADAPPGTAPPGYARFHPGQESTAPPLSVTDLFTGRPGEQGYAPQPATLAASGALVLVPDTSAWRLPATTPTPSPTPLPDVLKEYSIPRLPLLIAREELDGGGREESSPALQSRGLDTSGSVPRGRVLVTFQTPWTHLRTQYRLIPVDRDGKDSGTPLVFIHTARTQEQFTLAAGRWRLEQRFWAADRGTTHLTKRYPPQNLSAGTRYEFIADASEETRLLTRLRKEER